MTFCRFLLTDRESLFSHALQRIEVVQINAIQLANGRFDVTWHGQIDHEERPVPAGLQERRYLIQGDDRVRRSRRTDQYIQVAELLLPILKMNCSSANSCRQSLRSLERAIGDKNLFRSASAT